MSETFGPDTFMSGEQSYKYSHVSNPQIVTKTMELSQAMDRTQEILATFQQDITDLKFSAAVINDHNQQIAEQINCMLAQLAGLSNTVNNVHEEHLNQLHDMITTTWIIYNSPLFRFLNFFGCWYIYLDKRQYMGSGIYPNKEEYEMYGNRPFFTRVKLWFVDKKDQILAWKEKHFPKKKTKENTEEETKE